MKYLSLFSGIGGFELGIQLAYESNRNRRNTEKSSVDGGVATSSTLNEWVGKSPTCIGYSEIDKYATQIYQKHFPNHKNYGDITKIDDTRLPSFDLLVGGFPCQSFSIAGKRQGFEDTRGTLFFEIARILRTKQPRLLLLENVKGLLSHDYGITFKTIISTLDELGYDLQWQVLNSKNFGVPQNRERVFIVGHLRGTGRPEVFPIGENNGGNNEQDELRTGRKLLQGNVIKRFQGEETETVSEPSGQSSPLGGDIANDSNGRGGKTHTTYKIRRLTPTECERLQGFPDGWTEGISDTQRYKCLGNAVTVNVIETIVRATINHKKI
jgi:DNA (cytosine-5)-methyltransferase 1